jgi:hypothetical protein
MLISFSEDFNSISYLKIEFENFIENSNQDIQISLEP